MTDHAKLTELLERVKAAAGPDRELFLSVARGIVPAYDGALDFRASLNAFVNVRAWESAALALVERVFPEADFDICYRRGKLRSVKWYDPKIDGWRVYENPLPILAALLTALLARENTQ